MLLVSTRVEHRSLDPSLQGLPSLLIGGGDTNYLLEGWGGGGRLSMKMNYLSDSTCTTLNVRVEKEDCEGGDLRRTEHDHVTRGRKSSILSM